MIRTLWKPLAIISSVLLILTYLLMRSAPVDPRLHQRVLAALHELEINDARLNQDLLKARAGLLTYYDPLDGCTDAMEKSLALLRSGGVAAYGEATVAIEQLLDTLAGSMAYKQALVDTFKSDNALLQNSLMHFTYASYELSTQAQDDRPSQAAEIGTLANTMLRFLRYPQEDTVAELDGSLNRLAHLPRVTWQVRTLIAHSRLIVDMLPKVNQTLGQLLTAPTTVQIHTLRATYLQYQGRMEMYAKFFRFLLYGLAVALLAYLIYLLVRLRLHTRALAEQSSVLQSRLHLESLVATISTQFINLPPDQVDANIYQALETLGRYLAVDRAYLFLFSEDRKRVATIHEWCHEGIEAQIDRFKSRPVADFRWTIDHLEQQGYLHVPRISNLPPQAALEQAHFEAQGMRSLLCISVQCAGKSLGVFGFVMVRAERHWSNEDIALLRSVGEIFANAMERKQAEVEREKLAAQLRQSHKLEAIGTLAGGIAHDFNNILGAILGYSELALATLRGGSRPRYYVQQVLTAGQRAKAVVDQILTFSRHGSRECHLMRVQPLVQETIELLRASLPSTLIIQAHLEAETATMQGDPTQLQQVVMNLCTNAAQAIEGSGTLAMALNRVEIAQELTLSHGILKSGCYVRLTVSDTGHGMDAATLERMFDPFFTTKAVGRGTGLGLSTVHGIVTDHGGALHVHSQPGQGSTFEVYFLCAEEGADSPVEVETPLPYGQGETILLVDDEQPLVLLGEDMLAVLGYEPVGFDNSGKALASFRADPHRFDLVLIDQVMPELSGMQLAAALHEIRPELPILLITGYSGPVLLQSPEAMTLGIREILRKPLQARDLAASIARHLPVSA